MRNSFLKNYPDSDDSVSSQQETPKAATDLLSPDDNTPKRVLPLKEPVQSETVKLVKSQKSIDSPDDDVQSATPTNKTTFQYNSLNNNISTDYGNKISNEQESNKEVVVDTDDGFEENTATKPRFISELPEEISVVSGDCARLDVVIEGDPLPSVHWFKDGQRLAISGRINTLIDGSKYSLVIRNARQTDDAEYECRAFNDYGEISCFCELFCHQL